MTRTITLGLLLAIGLALTLRCPRLDVRPMHNDEAVNAVKLGQLWDHGTYKYDPNEHHGPSLYYAALALGWLTGAPDFAHYTEKRLRLVTVLFGLGLLLLLPLMADGLGRNGTIWAALFTAVSPALVFYSRYYIHEMLLAFFTCLALGASWRYWRTRKIGWALLAGAAAGLMQATKETFVITLAAAALALCLNQGWNRLLAPGNLAAKGPRFNCWHLAAALGIWLVVVALLFSSFFANADGPLDSLRAYQPWLSRAGGNSPHLHPWDFYFHRLLFFHPAKGPVWTEALILFLAIYGVIAGFRRGGLGDANAGFVRFLSFYAFLLAAFYSLVPYKTPWCLLSFWHGMVLLAGVGAAVLLRLPLPRAAPLHRWLRPALTALLLAGAVHLAWQASQASTTYAADRRNPYVYAQTSPDLLRLVSQIEALAEVSPQGRQMLIKVMAPEGDYWPLPWYLRRFGQVGWWERVPAEPFAPIMIVSPALQVNLADDQTHPMVGYFEMRPQAFFALCVQSELWQDYLARR